jgi:hypothetical protein
MKIENSNTVYTPAIEVVELGKITSGINEDTKRPWTRRDIIVVEGFITISGGVNLGFSPATNAQSATRGVFASNRAWAKYFDPEAKAGAVLTGYDITKIPVPAFKQKDGSEGNSRRIFHFVNESPEDAYQESLTGDQKEEYANFRAGIVKNNAIPETKGG